MILIELNGLRQLVESLDGYDGWTVVDANTNDPRTLAERQADLWEAVKAKREIIETGTAPTPSGAVQIDEQSKLKINGLVTMAMLADQQAQPFSEDFTIADNSVVTLDAAATIAMGVAVGQFVSDTYARARELRDAIEAATDVANLEAIDIDTGWPT
jgi:hypothetical protein